MFYNMRAMRRQGNEGPVRRMLGRQENSTKEQWEIRLDPRTGTLDLEGLRRRKFTEF